MRRIVSLFVFIGLLTSLTLALMSVPGPTTIFAQTPDSAGAVTAVPPHPLLSDVRIRRALAYCTDRPALIASVYPWLTAPQRQTLLMDTFLPKTHPLYSAPAADYQYSFSPAQGRQLLEDAGWSLPQGATYRRNAAGYELAIKLITTNAGFRQTWGAALEQQWRDNCGIRLLRSHISSSVFFGDGPGSLQRRDMELGAFSWVGQANPGGLTLYGCDYIPTVENGWEGQNYMGWCNPTVNTALLQAYNTLDTGEIAVHYATVQAEFAQDMVSLPLFQRVETSSIRQGLQNYALDPTDYDTSNAHAWAFPGVSVLQIIEQEPNSLARNENWAANGRLDWLIFDKGYSQRSFGYQPALLTQLPTLASGLARNDTVDVQAGAAVINADGLPAVLAPGISIKDATGATVVYAGGVVQMKQMSVPYRFQPNISWSDGQALKQADIELGRLHDCDPGANMYGMTGVCSAIAAMVTTNTAYTITYKPGYQSAVYFLPPFNLYPSHQVITTPGAYTGQTLAQVPAGDWFDLAEYTERPLGVGPYRLKEWTRGQRMVLERNPFYWRGASSILFDEIIVRFDLTFEQAQAALEAGTIHILPYLSQSDSSQVEIKTVGSATWEHMDVNLDLFVQAAARPLTPAGGSVTTQVGISLTVPAGALGENATVIVDDIATPLREMTGAFAPLRAFLLEAINGAGQALTQFSPPLTLVVTYTDAQLATRGIDEATINVMYWDGAAWAPVLPCAGCGVDRANNRITAQLGHFSEFALTGQSRIFLPAVER